MNNLDCLIIPNPNVKLRKSIVSKIIENDGYCISQERQSPETKCHCKHFKQTGECLCGLFILIPVTEVTS